MKSKKTKSATIEEERNVEYFETPLSSYDNIEYDEDGEVIFDDYDDYPPEAGNLDMTFGAAYDSGFRIFSSLDLSDYTDMVNTYNVRGDLDTEKKQLHIGFVDVRDYDEFVVLLKEREEAKRHPLRALLKKPRSIFIHVRTRIFEKEYYYVYELTNCRIKGISSIEHMSGLEGSNSYYGGAVFKYKKLKIKDLYDSPASTEGEEDK